MTTDVADQMQVAEVLNGLVEEAESVAARRRDPSIPAGTVLSESESGGVINREVQTSSMVRMEGSPSLSGSRRSASTVTG